MTARNRDRGMMEMPGSPIDDITALVLVGGKSRRMGSDKAFLDIDGTPMFERVLEVLRSTFPSIILTGDRREPFARYGLTQYADIYPGSSLGGLYTGLVHAATDRLFVCPCDIPFPSSRVIRHLCSLAEGWDAVVPCPGHGYEPLFAVYAKSCLQPIKDQLECSNHRVVDFYPRIRVRSVVEAELRNLDATGLSFTGLNTPEDVEKILAVREACRSRA